MRAFCILASVAVALILAGTAAAQEEHAGHVHAEGTPALKEMEGNICPVMAGPIDKKYNYTYKGTIYYFCCPACLGDFKADPEKYAAKMGDKK